MKYRIVVAAIVEKNGKYLYGRKAKDVGPFPNQWLILGGGVNLEHETLEEGMRREIREEGNIEVGELTPLFFEEDIREKDGKTIHYLFLSFRTTYLSGETRPGDDIAELKWFTKDELSHLDLPEINIRLLKRTGILP